MLPWGRKRGSDYAYDEPDHNKNLPPHKRLQDWKKPHSAVPLTAIPSWGDVAEKDRKNQATYEKGASCGATISLSKKVSLWRGDITTLQIDAIVNAANCSLLGGGGVDGAIHSAAGPELLKECRKLGGCDTGDAKLTPGYKLPAKYVLHTVGPTNGSRRRLKSCYSRCLQLALENNIRSLAFCCLATGIYGYPNKDAAHVALETVREWLEMDGNIDKVDRIIFCVFLEIDHRIYKSLLPLYFPVESYNEETSSRAEKDNSFKDTATVKKQQTEEEPSLHCQNVLMPVDYSTGPLATSEGYLTSFEHTVATSEGSSTTFEHTVVTSTGSLTTSEGSLITSEGSLTTSEGYLTTSEGSLTTSEGSLITSEGSLITSEGSLTTSEGSLITSEGSLTTSEGYLTTSEGSLTTSEGYLPSNESSGATSETPNATPEDLMECLTDTAEAIIHTSSEGSMTMSTPEDTNVITSKLRGTASYEEGTQSSRVAVSTVAETTCDKPSVCAADTRSTNSAGQDTTLLPGIEDLGAEHDRKLCIQKNQSQAISELCACTDAIHKASSCKWRTPENVVESKSCEVQRTPLKTSIEAGIEQTPSSGH